MMMETGAPKVLYQESRWHWVIRRYAALSLLGGSLAGMLGLVAAILSDYFFGLPDLGARSLNFQSWLVLGVVGGGGVILLASSFIAEVQLTRRALIGLDEVVLGRGRMGRRFPSLLGTPPLPARVELGSIRKFRLETFEPIRTFPTYRWYRAWRAQFELSDGRVVPLDPSVDGFYPPPALEALLRLASYLKDRGVDVEVREGGAFHMRKLDRKRSW